MIWRFGWFWCQTNWTIRFFFWGGERGKMCVTSICKKKHVFFHSRWWFQRFFLISSVWMKLRNTWNWNQLVLTSSVTIFQAYTYIHLSLVANDFHFPIFQMAWNHQRSRRSYTTFTDLREKPSSPASWRRWDTSSEKNYPDCSRCYDFLKNCEKKMVRQIFGYPGEQWKETLEDVWCLFPVCDSIGSLFL